MRSAKAQQPIPTKISAAPSPETAVGQGIATPFHTVHEVCVLVPQVDEAVSYYESVGIGPWAPVPPLTDLARIEGADPDTLAAIAYRCTQIDGIQLQLGQPGAGSTPQADFLAQHGPGVFQIGFSVDDIDEAERHASALGLDVILRARGADGTGFSYFDTYNSAGVILQCRQPPKAQAHPWSPGSTDVPCVSGFEHLGVRAPSWVNLRVDAACAGRS